MSLAPEHQWPHSPPDLVWHWVNVRKEAQWMEAAIRLGALRVRDVLTMAYRGGSSGAAGRGGVEAKAGAAFQTPAMKEEGTCYPG